MCSPHHVVKVLDSYEVHIEQVCRLGVVRRHNRGSGVLRRLKRSSRPGSPGMRVTTAATGATYIAYLGPPPSASVGHLIKVPLADRVASERGNACQNVFVGIGEEQH